MSFKKLSSILDFQVYNSIFEIVFEINNYFENNINKDYYIINDLKLDLLNILKQISIGFNRYYPKDKINSYLLAKDYISSSLSNLIFLNKLDFLEKSKFIYFYSNLENKLKYINGLLKTFEKLNKD